jgi:hypothetical protein
MKKEHIQYNNEIVHMHFPGEMACINTNTFSGAGK